MIKNNILVVGLGSMGKRRIRLARQLNDKINFIGVDSNKDRRDFAIREYGIEAAESLDFVLNRYVDCIDGVFVCTSPLSHSDIIIKSLKKGLNVFTEINLVNDGYDRILRLINEGQILFLSSTFLYRKDIQWIIKKTAGQKLNYVYHSGQYLPDWHPWEDYKNYFVNDKRTNGCREILAIEMPWIVKCFGEIKSFTMKEGKVSSLNLSYNDSYMFLIEHINGSFGMIAVDVVSRKPQRRLEVYNENMHIFWEGTQTLCVNMKFNWDLKKNIGTYDEYEHHKDYSDNIIENAYKDEIDAFFSAINERDQSKILYSLEEDNHILKMLDKMGV